MPQTQRNETKQCQERLAEAGNESESLLFCKGFSGKS